MDEPETYLHPDLHRRLLALLRRSGPQIILATHSSDIVAESDPSDLHVIERGRKSALRIRDREGVQSALTSIGSDGTYELTSIIRTRRILFAEGRDDLRLLRRLAAASGLNALAEGSGVTPYLMEGHRPLDATAARNAIIQAIGQNVKFSIVLDRDYRSEEELQAPRESLSEMEHILIHGGKEIENYVLKPQVIARILRGRRKNPKISAPNASNIGEMLDRVAEDLKPDLFGRYVEEHARYLARTGKQNARRVDQITRTTRWFNELWPTQSGKLNLLPGKDTLARLNRILEAEFGLSVHAGELFDALEPSEIPGDVRRFLTEFDGS